MFIDADDKQRAAAASLRAPYFRRMIGYTWPHRRLLAIGMAASLVYGLLNSVGILGVLPVLLARSDRLLAVPVGQGRSVTVVPGLKKYYDKLGVVRYGVFVMLLLSMLALPIKMVLRWLFNLKYIVAMPEIFFNI